MRPNREAWLSYLASLAYSSGQRRTGMRMHADLVLREHRWRSLRSLLLGLAPESVRVARASRWVPPPPPPDLGDEVRVWLAPYAQPTA